MTRSNLVTLPCRCQWSYPAGAMMYVCKRHSEETCAGVRDIVIAHLLEAREALRDLVNLHEEIARAVEVAGLSRRWATAIDRAREVLA